MKNEKKNSKTSQNLMKNNNPQKIIIFFRRKNTGLKNIFRFRFYFLKKEKTLKKLRIFP